MAADHDDTLETSVLEGADPLVRVETGRLEEVDVLFARAPLDTRVRVHAVVDER